MKIYFIVPFFLLTNIGLSSSIVSVDAGNGHAIFLDSLGQVFTVGRNNYGQLGDSTIKDKSVLIKVKGLPKCKIAARGYDHSLAIDIFGHLCVSFPKNRATQK